MNRNVLRFKLCGIKYEMDDNDRWLLMIWFSSLSFFPDNDIIDNMKLRTGGHETPGLCFMPPEIDYFPVRRIFSTVRT